MGQPVVIHDDLRMARETTVEGLTWLNRLPDLIDDACRHWGVAIAGPAYQGGVCGWVAPVRGANLDAVLKVTWPHAEAATEAMALRWWDGAGTVRLLGEVHDTWTMLLERCDPGTALRDAGLPNERASTLGTELLGALWRRGVPSVEGPCFDAMVEVCDEWAHGAEIRVERHGALLRALGTDPGILALGIELLRSLPRSADRQVVVHGDFNPGNILAASRAPFLAIDPKPMVGDPAYDPWPLVAQLDSPFRLPDASRVVTGRVRLLAERLEISGERIAAWGVARDVQAGLWMASEGNAAVGARWIRSAAITAPTLNEW
jgi:streptomycin 6-kinase